MITDEENLLTDVILHDLFRVAAISGSEMAYDKETGIVDFNGCFRPVEIAKAIAAELGM